jgi:hypothetical protein
MSSWQDKATKALDDSLHPVPQELNVIDWKCALQMVRERFNLNKNQTVMASRILADALESGFIKMKDPETESKRYTSYIPYYG